MAGVVRITTRGSTKRTEKFLREMAAQNYLYSGLESIARKGVDALKAATPVDTGITAESWSYEIKASKDKCSISWLNNHREGGDPIVIMLQYGHGTGTGGYVQGRDFINPAIRPIFDQLADEVWKKVTQA